MKSLAMGLCVALSLFASGGCCCFWHNVHSALYCQQGGGYGGCGGNVGCGHAAPCETACEGTGCGHAGNDCGQGCNDCGQGCGGCGHGGNGDFTLLGGLFGWGCRGLGYSGHDCGCNGCSILGCSSHYLDPHGACYGAYCGNCCEKSGCGCMYWGDYWNVPPTTDPCDGCCNYVGPSHSPHGSTPCYYGPAPAYHGPHAAVASAPAAQEEVVVAEKKPATKTQAPAKTVNRPSTTKTGR
jgi:hypothetical protein